MSKWTLDTPPTWVTNATATDAGWVDGVTGELLVAIRGLATRRSTGATAVSASIATTSSKTKLKTGDVITLSVLFNEKVTVTVAVPFMTATIGANTRNVPYTSGSGTNTLNFSYTVAGGDTGNWTAISAAISANGATIKDTNDGTTNAVLTGVGALFPSTSAYAVDNTAPVAGNVVIFGGAKFTTGSVVKFKVPYAETVTVTGTPLLNILINGVARSASFTTVSGGDVYFEYTVVVADSCAALEFDLVGTISLNGGTILDSALNSAVLTGLVAEAFIDTIFVNTGAAAVSPTVSTVVGTTGTYKIGDTFPITVTFSQRVDVTGTPQFNFLVNGVAKTANYASGTGTTAIVFNYTVAEGNNALTGEVTYALNPIVLNSGTIKNSSLVASTITKTAATLTSVIFNGSYPTVSSSAFTGISHPAYVTADTLSLTLTFSEAVTVVGTPTIAIGIGEKSRTMSYASGSTTTALVFSYTVVAGDIALIPGQKFTIDNEITLSGGTIRDVAGNDAVLRFRRPSITSVSFNA